MLRIQNKNLSERLLQRKNLENELRDKLEKLQNRKVADDSKLCVIDRYWTQLDEDLRTMLERFNSNLNEDGEEIHEFKESISPIQINSSKVNENSITKPSSQPIRNFIAKLEDWDKKEIEENLKERVKFTTQTVSKLVVNFERFVYFNYYKSHFF